MNFEIENDKLIRHVPAISIDAFDSNIMRSVTVITKEEFLMCYKAWVENKEE